MFGYISPEKAHLYFKDFDLYTGFYCGVCKAMGRLLSQKARYTINYDITFLAALLHNYLDADVKLVRLKCIVKPFNTKRLMVEQNELTDKFAALNLLLSYHKVIDDVIDERSLSKRMAKSLLKKSYKRAKKILVGADEIIEKRYDELRSLEKEKCQSIDRVSDKFALMMQELAALLCEGKADDKLLDLCYNVGKWVYLIDAVDDIEEDNKKGCFNPFLCSYGDYRDFSTFVREHTADLDFMFGTTLGKIESDFYEIKFHFNTDLIENVLTRGLKIKTRSVLKGERCKKNIKY